MSDTRPPVLTREQIDQLADRISRHGGSISLHDKRVTDVQTWIITIVGVSLVGTLGWLIQSINTLNQTMTRVVTQNEYLEQRVIRLENRAEDRRP